MKRMTMEFDRARDARGPSRVSISYDPSTGVALFADATRGEDGKVYLRRGIGSELLVRTCVMKAYDDGEYSKGRDSMDFLYRAADLVEE